MEALRQLASTVIGKALIGIIIVLIGVIVALGFNNLVVSGERNVLQQTIKTKEAEIARKANEIVFLKAWMDRDKLDAIAKDTEFNRTMAAKPKFKTEIKYIPIGNNCVDLNAIIDEARDNKNTGRIQL